MPIRTLPIVTELLYGALELQACAVNTSGLLMGIPSGIQRTCVDKSLAIRTWGGVGGANIKKPATPLAPQPRRTTEY